MSGRPGYGGAGRRGGSDQGRAVQVDPIKPKLKLPGTKRLKLKCDEALSNFAFKIKLHRYIKEQIRARLDDHVAWERANPNKTDVLMNPRDRVEKEARDSAEMRLADEAWAGTSQYCPPRHATSRNAFEPLLLESYLSLRLLSCMTYYEVASNACQATFSRHVFFFISVS